jgi:hypothetical protein
MNRRAFLSAGGVWLSSFGVERDLAQTGKPTGVIKVPVRPSDIRILNVAYDFEEYKYRTP